MKYFKRHGITIPLNKEITGTITGTKVTGKINASGDNLYFCQSERDGTFCGDKLGYKYSWKFNIKANGSLTASVKLDLDLNQCKSKDYEIF